MEIYWKRGHGAMHVACSEGSTTTGPQDNMNREKQVGYVNATIPRFLQAREKYDGYQVRFYESLTVPEELMEAFSDGDVSKEDFRRYGQWRIDFPVDCGSHPEGKIKQILLVAHKILTRGRITLLSPFLEREFRKYFAIAQFDAKSFQARKYLALTNQAKKTNVWLDGTGAERTFVEEVLFDSLGAGYRHWAMPQVYLSSLVGADDLGSNVENQRVDFLISTKATNIVVELDGSDHIGHEDRDAARDALLRRWGYDVWRIGNEELLSETGENLDGLVAILRDGKVEIGEELLNTDSYVVAAKLAGQVQIVVLEALLTGALDFTHSTTICLDMHNTQFPAEQAQGICEHAVADLVQLLRQLAQLYGLEGSVPDLLISKQPPTSATRGIVISYGEENIASVPCFHIQDIHFPYPIAHFARPMSPTSIEEASLANLEFFLKYIFRKEHFWEGQYEAISRALAGKDAIVLLPTGGGKSIAFQLASMLLPGVTLVIDPIIALIDDQRDNLCRVGIDRVIGITGQITSPEVKSKMIKSFGQGDCLFCYVTPERLQMDDFRNGLRSLTLSTPICIITIDEAHCVSEWGHDFRPSYLHIGRTSRKHCAFQGQAPPLLALTGTASYSVLRDVQRELQVADFDAIITPKTFDRQELRYSVYEAPSDQKINHLQGLLQRTLPDKFGVAESTFFRPRGSKTYSGLIFCPFVNGDFGVARIKDEVSDLGIQVQLYSGKQPRFWSGTELWPDYKRSVARAFKSNKCPVLVATKAFGMGIDKPNIRYTVHFGIPPSIEAFYQEAGRAGRDRDVSECTLLFSVFDRARARRMLSPDTDIKELDNECCLARKNGTEDDITRALYFHTDAFMGVDEESSYVNGLIECLGSTEEKRVANIVFKRKEQKLWEKATHRLVVLGVIDDYTLNYSSCELKITLGGIDKDEIISHYGRYVSGYAKGRVPEELSKLQDAIQKPHQQFVKEAARVLIEFIYNTIEKGRRRALREMFGLAEQAADTTDCDHIVRSRILRYLESSHAEEIESILEEENGFGHLVTLIQGHENLEGELVGGIRSPAEASELRGQAARYLESKPDHPGLLFLRGISEIYCHDYNYDVVCENLVAGLRFGLSLYQIEKQSLHEMITWLLRNIREKRGYLCSQIVEQLVFRVDDPDFARHLISQEEFTAEMLRAPTVYLFSKLAREAVDIFKAH